jgi:gamma-glutamyltranspeptidase/glutathione hydrolase
MARYEWPTLFHLWAPVNDRLHEIQRSKLGDPLFVDGMANYEEDILKQSTIDDIRSKISDARTQNVSVYDPAGLESLET